MKRRVISLLMAAVFLLTASVFSVSVMAGTEPIVIIDDFENYTGGQPASATYANNTNNLVSGTDVVYGTYMKHKANCRLNFGFPNTAITSGKVYLSFDIKFEKGTAKSFAASYYNSEGSTEDAGSGLNAYLGVSNTEGTVFQIGTTKLFDVDANWHSVEYVMDISTGLTEVYHNGSLISANIGLDTLKEKGFGFVRFQETEAPFYLDNLRLIASDEDVLEMYAENTSDDENGALALDFTRSVKNISNIKASDITIKEVMTGKTLDVTKVTPVGYSRLNVEFDNTDAVAGAEYAVTVNGAELALETPVSLTAMFNTQSGDKTNTVLDDQIENYAGLGGNNDWSVYIWNSASKYQQEANYSTMTEATSEGMKVTLPQWTDTKYRSSFAIKNEFDKPIEPKGVITVEMRIYNDNMYELYPILYGKDTSNNTPNVWTRLGGFNKTPGFIGYVSQDIPGSVGSTANRPYLKATTFDGWHTIVTELDFDKNVARYKIDDSDWIVEQANSYPAPLKISNYNNVTKETFAGFEGIAISSAPWVVHTADPSVQGDTTVDDSTDSKYPTTNNGTGSYTVDYVKITQTLPNPVISKIRYVDYNGQEVLPNDVIDAEIDAVKLYFSTAVKTETLENAVSITGTNAPAVTYNSYDEASNCATYKFSDYLIGSRNYTLNIANTIKDEDGNSIANAGDIPFSTKEGKLIIKEFGFDKKDLAAANVNDVITLSVDIINTKGDGKDAQLSFGVYNDTTMTDFDYLPVEMDDTKATYNKSLPITVKDLNKLTIKGFLWDSFETIGPLINNCTLTNIAD